MNIIPQVGNLYNCYDGGNIISYCYSVYIKNVIRLKDFKNFNILKAWRENIKARSTLYSDSTDFFCEAIDNGEFSDEPGNIIWFVRTVEGTWFSIDLENPYSLSSYIGLLDVDGSFTKQCNIDF